MNELGAGYVILEFWHAGCGECYRSFPEVESTYNYISERSSAGREAVNLYSVFCYRRKDDREKGSGILSKRGYTYPTLSLPFSDPLLKELKVGTYPTVLIFDPQKRVVFRGSVWKADRYVKKIIGGVR